MPDPSQDTFARHPALPLFKLRELPPHGENLGRNHEGPAGRDHFRDLAGLVSGLGEDRLSWLSSSSSDQSRQLLLHSFRVVMMLQSSKTGEEHYLVQRKELYVWSAAISALCLKGTVRQRDQLLDN